MKRNENLTNFHVSNVPEGNIDVFPLLIRFEGEEGSLQASHLVENHLARPQNLTESQSLCWGFPDGLASKESTCNSGDTEEAGSIPELGRSPGEGSGSILA